MDPNLPILLIHPCLLSSSESLSSRRRDVRETSHSVFAASIAIASFCLPGQVAYSQRSHQREAASTQHATSSGLTVPGCYSPGSGSFGADGETTEFVYTPEEITDPYETERLTVFLPFTVEDVAGDLRKSVVGRGIPKMRWSINIIMLRTK